MMVELKPCPFCGSKADYKDDGQYGYAYCTCCLARTDERYSWRDSEWKRSVASEWNTRVGTAEEHKRLRKELKDAIKARELNFEYADELAKEIAKYFGIDIGDYTPINNPLENALKAIQYKDMLDLIERDKPKEPIVKKSQYGENYFCPNCENDVSYTYSHCSACGQRLDWSE